MPKIFKSSYVEMGETKEIGITHVKKVEKAENKPKDPPTPKIDLDLLYKKKMKEIEDIVWKRLQKAEDEAQRRSKEILDEAERESVKIYEEQKKLGYQQGKNEGYDVGQQQAQSIIKESLNIKNDMIQKRNDMVKNLEKQCIQLIIHIVEKVLYQKMENSYEGIIGLVKAALSKCAYTDKLILRVSEKDYSKAVEVKNQLLCLGENIDDITIKQDPSLSKGACILDTPSGSIDASLHTQIKQIKTLLIETLESE